MGCVGHAGVVEKANHVAAQQFWRTLPEDLTVEEAQARLGKWCTTRGDTRMRATADGRSTVATVAAAEPLTPLPAPFPATLAVQRVVSAQALVSFRGNRYSVPPQLHGAIVTVTVRLGATHLDIATAARAGPGVALPTVLARHALATAGAGATVRDDGHVLALEAAVLAVAPPNARTGARNAAHRPPRPWPRPPPCADDTPARRPAAATSDRPPPLRPRRGRTQHPDPRRRCGGAHHEGDRSAMTPTPPAGATVAGPSSTAPASLYQQLRGHLAALKLHDAAEHLPAVLDAARAEGLSLTATLERLLVIEVGHRGPAAGLAAAVRLPAHPGEPGGLRLRRATRDRPAPDRRPRLVPLPRERHEHPAHRPTGGR